jgi:hypothetical protein
MALNSVGDEMFAELEDFFKAHEHTVAALEAVSTLAVVVVSVTLALLAQRANRTKIKAFVSMSVMLHSTLEGKPKPTYVTVFIRNVGVMPVMIPFSFFHWKAPFKAGGWTVNPWDYSAGDEWVPQKRYPIEIKPRSSETFFLAEKSVFRSTMLEMLSGANFIDRCRFRFLRARVVTDDNKLFDVKTDCTLHKELRLLRDEAFRTPTKTLSTQTE